MSEEHKPQADRIEEVVLACLRELRNIRSLMPVLAFLLMLIAGGILWACVIAAQEGL